MAPGRLPEPLSTAQQVPEPFSAMDSALDGPSLAAPVAFAIPASNFAIAAESDCSQAIPLPRIRASIFAAPARKCCTALRAPWFARPALANQCLQRFPGEFHRPDNPDVEMRSLDFLASENDLSRTPLR